MEKHIPFIKQAIQLAYSAREKGNHPFGAVLVDSQNNVVHTAENTVITSKDRTRHAELNLISEVIQIVK
jgi:tRNA(Arg) A34 adenosine deaminase TadA